MILVKKIVTTLGLKGPAVHFLNLYREFKSRHKWNEIRAREHVLLEFGSGSKEGVNGWTTVDLSGADIAHDLRKGIPLPDNSVDRIYTSHMLEHIPYKSLVIFLNECYRALKVGGELSVCVPNAGLYINAYISGKEFRERDKGYKPAHIGTGSFLDQVNYIAYMDGEHHYMFDEENLINTIKKAPFSTVILRHFDPEIDMQSRDFESIYASAVK